MFPAYFVYLYVFLARFNAIPSLDGLLPRLRYALDKVRVCRFPTSAKNIRLIANFSFQRWLLEYRQKVSG